MYPYHNRISQRINNGEFLYAEHATHPTIGECIIFHFSTTPFMRPIRPHSYWRYPDIITN